MMNNKQKVGDVKWAVKAENSLAGDESGEQRKEDVRNAGIEVDMDMEKRKSMLKKMIDERARGKCAGVLGGVAGRAFE